MKIERFITVYDNKTEELKKEINIDYVDVPRLAKALKTPDSDPLIYQIYEIRADAIFEISELLTEVVVFDLLKNSYYVECYQLPPFEFGRT